MTHEYGESCAILDTAKEDIVRIEHVRGQLFGGATPIQLPLFPISYDQLSD